MLWPTKYLRGTEDTVFGKANDFAGNSFDSSPQLRRTALFHNKESSEPAAPVCRYSDAEPPDQTDRLGEDNLLPERRQRLELAVQGRMQGLRVVLDGVGDPRNRAAV
jgi:hypothetical protein